MLDSYGDRVRQLLDQSYSTPSSMNRISLAEEAARIADLHGDVDLGYEARMGVVDAAVFTGAPDRALVAFGWLLSRFDADPTHRDQAAVLWRYKWILAALPRFPAITREQLERSDADLERRYRHYGYNLNALHKLRTTAAVARGDREAARDHFERWQNSARDASSDCRACEVDDIVHYRLFMNGAEAALEAAAPILDGRLSCSQVPHHTIGLILGALVDLDRADEAREWHQRGYRLIRRNPTFLRSVADHVVYLVRVHELDSAKRLIVRHMRWFVDSRDPAARFRFALAAIEFASQYTDSKHGGDKLPTPTEVQGTDTVEADLAAFRAWFIAFASSVAEEYDARCGAGYHRRLVGMAQG